MNGPTFLATAGDMDVVPSRYLPTVIDDGQRMLVYDGRRGYVSPENFEWMKTAGPAELGAMRVIRINDVNHGWLTRAPTLKLDEFRFRSPLREGAPSAVVAGQGPDADPNPVGGKL